MTPISYPAFPAELKSLPNWVVWRSEKRFSRSKNEKATKVPYEPKTGTRAKSNDSGTWSSFDVACDVARQDSYNGIGFVFTELGGILGVDLDHCRQFDTGIIEDWAQEIIDILDSYTEISPSGTGVHIYVKAQLASRGRRKGNIEFYNQGRYFTVTGQHLADTPLEVHERQEQIDQLYERFFSEDKQPSDNPKNNTNTPAVLLDIFELTRRAQNDNKFQSLFAGNTSGHQSPSEADLALCCKLAFYTQGDFLNIDKFFRISGLFRPKWDEKHGARTYGDMTIIKALQVQREYYSSSDSPKNTPSKPKKQKQSVRYEESHTEAEPTPTFTLSDMGNSERFMKQHGHGVRYCTTWNSWYLWNGKYWEMDEKNNVHRLAKLTVRKMYIEAAKKDDDKERRALVKYALKSEGNREIKNLLEQATWDADVVITANELDAQSWLLNLKNGTLDLRTNTLRPHQRKDLLTHYVDIPHDPEATAPLWTKFLERVMNGNQSLIGFLQRAVGYSLTSETCEQCLFFLHGQGQNGKTTFIETALEKLLGKYARRISTEALLLKRHPSNANNEIARLKGARIAITSEISQGRRFNESLVKDLSGEDTISARFLYSEPFDFKPTSKLWVYGNHKPIITGIDEGIWRRIKLIPFTIRIPDVEKDVRLKKKLEEELPGILQWAIQGCQQWQQYGLQTPQEVIEATQDYRKEMDSIELFLEECCLIQPGVRTTAKALYEAYTSWCQKSGEQVLSQHRLGERLTKRGLEKKRSTGGSYGWIGIGLLE